MIIALLAAWVFGGFLLAVLVGGVVRVADARDGRPMPVEQAEVATPVAA